MRELINLKVYQEIEKLKKYVKLNTLFVDGGLYIGFLNNKRKFTQTDLKKLLAILNALTEFVDATKKVVKKQLENYGNL